MRREGKMTKRTGINRRKVIKGASALLAMPALFKVTQASAQTPVFKIGYVSPQTGPLAGFAEADSYILGGVRKALAGVKSNGKAVDIQIIAKDSQSSSNRAAEVATEL